MKNYSLLFYFFFTLIFTSCKTETNTQTQKTTSTATYRKSSTERKTPKWAINSNIYEVNIRQYTPEGTFNAFAKHLPRLKNMGVDILWLMPIYPISNTKKKGSLGSYYAVSDFKAVNPEFGSMQDMDNLIQRIHSMGMKVIIDWVPNHTGWDHVWIKQHPEYYTQNESGEIVDPIDPQTGESWGWTDVADLNYDNKAMRREMIADMLYWVNEKKVDGFRMDVAHGVPDDFWKEATDQLYASNDSLFMLAESENPDHINNGYFHAIYGWPHHHTMNDIAKGQKNVNDLDSLLKQSTSAIPGGMYMHFVTNHDENSWAGTVEERMGPGADAFTVLAMTMDGIPLIYSGQEEPLTKRLEFFEKDEIGFKNYKKQRLIKTLLDLKKRNKAMWHGSEHSEFIRVAQSEYIYAYMKEQDGHKFAVMVNLSDQKQQITLDMPVWGMTNIFSGKQVEMGEGTIKSFDPWEYWVASNK